MKLQMHDGVVAVTLSRRNLEALLVKLDDPSSARTLIKHENDGWRLDVTAEENDTHYDRPEGPAGPILPAHEQTMLERFGL